MAKKKTAKPKQPTFEKSLEELEAIVAKLEGGKLGLDESLDEYEQGVKHLKACYNLLNAAERRIELVSKVDSEGNASTSQFEADGDETLEQKGASRSRKRSASLKTSTPRRKTRDEVDDESSLF